MIIFINIHGFINEHIHVLDLKASVSRNYILLDLHIYSSKKYHKRTWEFMRPHSLWNNVHRCRFLIWSYIFLNNMRTTWGYFLHKFVGDWSSVLVEWNLLFIQLFYFHCLCRGCSHCAFLLIAWFHIQKCKSLECSFVFASKMPDAVALEVKLLRRKLHSHWATFIKGFKISLLCLHYRSMH